MPPPAIAFASALPLSLRASPRILSATPHARPKPLLPPLRRSVLATASNSSPSPPAEKKKKSSPFAVRLGTSALFLSLPILLLQLLTKPLALLPPLRSLPTSLSLLWLRLTFSLSSVPVTVVGKKNLPSTPALYVANAASSIDIFALASLRRPFLPLVPARAKSAPFIGWVMALGAWIGLGATRREQMASLADVGKALASGRSVAVFPEGKVSARMGKFSPAIFRAARKAGVPVVPVSVSGTQCMFDGQEVVPARRGDGVTVVVHESIEEGFEEKEACRIAEKRVREGLPEEYR